MTILIIVLIVLAIPFVVALFQSSSYTIVRDITINRSRNEIFDYIRILKNSEQYSKWVMTDPAMKKEYKGTDGAPGFIYAWDSANKNVGKGEQEISRVIAGERIDYNLRFIKPFEGDAGAYITTESIAPDQTKVTWAFLGEKNYMAKFMHMVLPLVKMLGKDLSISLGNLKNVLEK